MNNVRGSGKAFTNTARARVDAGWKSWTRWRSVEPTIQRTRQVSWLSKAATLS